MAEKHADYDLVFESQALPAGTLFLNTLYGREELSRLFEFKLEVETDYAQGLSYEQIDDMLAKPASVAFGKEREHKIHGVLRAVEMLSTSRESAVRYELVMVPKLWYTTQTAGSWVYLDMTVPEMIRDVLTLTGLADGDDFELRLSGTYAKREYTLQYQESDFDFIARLMEHDGIFFYWEHTEEREKLVMCDDNAGFKEIPGRESIAFDPRGGTTDLKEVIVTAARRRDMIPRSVIVKDYNYRTPSTPIRTGLDIDDQGHGEQVRYGDNYKDLAAAKHIAKLRAEEIYARRETFRFDGRVRGLRAGHKFTFVDHFMDAMLQAYVVTAITHSAKQYGGGSDAKSKNQGYTNQFDCIPFETAYRPPLRTPKPQIAGFTQARVDGVPVDDGTTPIDPEGKYKIASMIDSTKTGTHQASHWVRRAQPYSGQNYGMHFPLHVGAEVMLIHVDGDPDRPVIVGTPPNPEHGTPVGQVDSQRSRIVTRSRMVMGWHDRRG